MKFELTKKFEQLGSEMPMFGPSDQPGKQTFDQMEGSGTQKHPAKPAQPEAMKFLD